MRLSISSVCCAFCSAAILSVLSPKLGAQNQNPAPPPVVVAEVIEAPVNSGYRVVGTVIPLRSSVIGTAVAGRVSEYLVELGHPVREGQPLTRLRTGTLELELSAAQAELELYEQQLAELENGSRPEDVAEAEANADAARSAAANAQRQLARLQSLAATRAATEADVEDARERAELTKFMAAASEAALKRVRAGPRREQIAQRQAQVSLQRERIAMIEDRLSKHTIVAPFDGYVSVEHTEIGAWLSSGDPVVEIIQLDAVEVRVPVTADYVTKLELGDTIRVEFPELPDKLLTGTVDRLVPLAETGSRTYPVFVRLENEFRGEVPLLMGGMLARVDLPAGTRRILPLVPKDALVLNEGERFIYVIDAEDAATDASTWVGTARRVDVDLGVAWDSLIQVQGDLQAGDFVVVVGNERLQPGKRVTAIPQEISTPSDAPE